MEETMKRIIMGLVVGMLALGGCYKATFVSSAPPSGPVHKKKVFFFIYGLLGQPQKVNVTEFCPDGSVHQIRTQMTVGNALLQGFTGGIVAPRTVLIQCAAPSSASADAAQVKQAELLLNDSGIPTAAVLTTQDGTQLVGDVQPSEVEGQFAVTVQ
jgi:hypothetical protein